MNLESNHSPTILKQFPILIKSQLSLLSSSEETCRNFVTPYQGALEKSVYKHKLEYLGNITTSNNKIQRKRNIIWFNSPYSKNIKTNIGKVFLNLIKKHEIYNSQLQNWVTHCDVTNRVTNSKILFFIF